MLKTYFLTAYRALLRNRSYSILNILGLSLSITCSLLLFLVIRYELSIDKFHAAADQIYRLTVHENYESGSIRSGSVHFPAAGVLRNNNPGIVEMAQVYGEEEVQVTVPANGQEPPKYFNTEHPVAFIEPEFFHLFDFGLNLQDKGKALKEPNMAILTQSYAAKYFPDTEAVGKVISLNNKLNLKVAAVIPDLPKNTDFPFGIFVSYPTLKNYIDYDLTAWSALTSQQNLYLKLPANADTAQVRTAITKTLKAQMPEKKRERLIFVLQPLKNLHYDSTYETYSRRTTSMEVLGIMAVIGVFLLATACINFINLATAQATKRSKEVGIRKVLGSNQKQLMLQFLGETFLLTLAAGLFSVVLAELTLPFLNRLLDLQLTFSLLEEPGLLLFFLLELLVVTLFAGLYPAFVLSGFQPIQALKSKMARQQMAGISLRKGLVLVQFTICQLLIICTLVVSEQMRYMRNKDLGFNKEAVVLVPLYKASAEKMFAYRQEITKLPGVQQASFIFSPPSSDFSYTTNFTFDNQPHNAAFQVNMKLSDEHYISLFGIKLLAGRDFTHQPPTDTIRQIVINQTMQRQLGLKSPEEALGKKMLLGRNMHGIIVGVAKDYHQNSLRESIRPIAMVNMGGASSNIYFLAAKVAPGQTQNAIQGLEKVWQKAYPDYIFEYQFLDQTIADFYKEDQRRNTLFRIFSGISIFIGCLGLYGLVSFMATQRTKEVGIRKVMGASLWDITYLFSKEFIQLVLLAFLVAAPLAYYFMNKWLQDFEYRITLSPAAFLIAGMVTMSIALLTMSFQAIKAARKNPVLALKTE
ncbi:ABC transporter permease [Adhaeribacter soli]|uniref:FtsX-like permease family protein n=1 Tax=Adhaeribacter soli TaxID=2607655 RepID=A0A5N1IM68_9BACT|nr:ABC transporter permease [Adhaeribacter soli]KAA9325007.1 FtsX-like permease family protein [Adhaeribacter soli]